MYLGTYEEQALTGEHGGALRWAYETLVRIGEGNGAESLTDVVSVHIPRMSLEDKNLRNLLEEVRSFHPRVQVSADPWSECHHGSGLTTDAVCQGTQIQSITCAPFLSGNTPPRGSRCSWGGRSAVTFLNSIIGARSNPQDFRSALASAISGKTPLHGLLTDEGRFESVVVRLDEVENVDASLLGHRLSQILDGRMARISGLRRGFDDMRRFALALNHDGRQPLFHLGGGREPDSIDLCHDDFLAPEPDDGRHNLKLIFGCPHLSEQQINSIARRLEDDGSNNNEAFFYTSRLCMDKSPKSGLLLRRHGTVRTSVCPLADAELWHSSSVCTDSLPLVESLQADGLDAQYLPFPLLMERLVG